MDISMDKHVVGPWVFAQVGKTWGPEGREAIGVVDGDQVLGGAVFEDYSGRSIIIHFALEHPHVPIRRLLVACARYAYNQMRVNKVLAPVSSANTKSINFVMKVGFQPEAIVKEAMPDGDLLLFSMTQEQCGFTYDVKEVA